MNDNVIDLKVEPLSSNAAPDMAVDVIPNIADQELQTTVIANADVNNSNNNTTTTNSTNNANSNSNGVLCKGVVASSPVNNHIHDHGDSISSHNHAHSNGNHTSHVTVSCNVNRNTSHNHANSNIVNGHVQGHVTSPVSRGHGEFGHSAKSPTASGMQNSGPCYQPVESKSAYLLKCGKVMTDDQFETLRRQISVYSTICSQLVEMHKALMAQQALLPNMMLMGQQQLPYDPVLGGRSSGRQRWTPSQVQLQILENLFEKSNGTPSKQKIKEITAQLGQHGSISETNVYNWFQNRKARAKRKQQQKDGESEVEPEDGDNVRKDKRAAIDMLRGRPGSGTFALDVDGLATAPNSANHMFDNSDASQAIHMRPQVDATNLFDQGGLMQRNNRDFTTIVVFIDGKPWEVPSTTLDLKGSFGEGLALLDSQQQIVPTDENGFTSRPLHAGENYTLVKFNNGV